MSKLLDDLQGRAIGVYENPEYEQEVSLAAKDKLKTCALCGKPFIKNRKAIYCKRLHYTTCVNCGNHIDLTDNYFRAGFAPKTCCKTCADTVGAQTMKDNCMEKYGVTNPMHVQEYADRAFTRANPHLDLSMRKAEETRTCKICGKEFTVYRTDPKQCCSESCATKLREQNTKIRTVKCKLCGKEFITKSGKACICANTHYRNCVICGNSFLLKSSDSLTVTCSEVCRMELTRQTNLARYGVEVGSQSAQAKEKLSAAYYLSESARQQTCLVRYGTSNPTLSDTVRQKISESVSAESCQQKIADTCLSKYGVRHSSQSSEIHRKQWHNRKNIRGCDGTPLDSTWERIVYDFWKSLGLTVERNIPIEFDYQGKKHTTFVDFRIDGVLYEVKGNHFLTGGVNENSNFPMSVKLDVYRENNVVIIARDSSQDLFEDGTLTGIDLALFEDLPDFPYDFKTRWTIIEYLVKHKKGFIGLEDFLQP